MTPVLECTHVTARQRVRGERPRETAVDDRLHGCRGGIVVEPDPAHANPVTLRAQAERLVGGVEVVLGGDDLVAGAQAKAAVDEAGAHRRRVRERYLLRRGAEVGGGRPACLLLEGGLGLAQVERRIPVERVAMSGDRLAHDPRMRGEEKGRQVDVRRIEVEVAAARRLDAVAGALSTGGVAADTRQRRGARRQASAHEELAAPESSP